MTEQIVASPSTIRKGLVQEMESHQWKQFNDIFDILDDNNDTLEYTDAELNRYFLSGHLKSIIEEEEMMDFDVKLS